MEENKRPRLVRKLWSKIITMCLTFGTAVYCLINMAEGPIWFALMMTNLIGMIYYLEGVFRVRKRLKGLWD